MQAQKELAAAVNKPKRVVPLMNVKDELLEVAYAVAGDRIEAALYTPSKVARHQAVEALKREVEAEIKKRYPEATNFEVSQAFDYLQKKAFRISILDKRVRCDGRQLNELRPLSAEVRRAPALPRLRALRPRRNAGARARHPRHHGRSAGCSTPTPAARRSKPFILHYNFPPFSVGETGRTGSPGRREIGHGALAERSIAPVLPSRGGLSRTPSASAARSWNPTAPPRWRRSAPASSR